ncbi:MAG: YdcF family protein [Spirochaetaceae bacterium]|nr:YdcF family protein [Spirochaetaceae bacterium]
MIDAHARILWDYLRLNQSLKKSDCILVMCSHDLRIADYAAGLFIDGWAPFIVFSGGIAHQGDLLDTGWNRPEADVFADRAVSIGVPEKCILREIRASNTGENILFTEALLKENEQSPNSFIIVQKPYMERRAYATVKAQRPNWDFTVTSPPLNFEEYPDPDQGFDKGTLIQLMVGDLQRIRDYPAKGFQIPLEIPEKVRIAYKTLAGLGFDGHMTK